MIRMEQLAGREVAEAGPALLPLSASRRETAIPMLSPLVAVLVVVALDRRARPPASPAIMVCLSLVGVAAEVGTQAVRQDREEAEPIPEGPELQDRAARALISRERSTEPRGRTVAALEAPALRGTTALSGPLLRPSLPPPLTRQRAGAGRALGAVIRGASEAVTVVEAERSLPERSTLPPAILIAPTRGTEAGVEAARRAVASPDRRTVLARPEPTPA